MSILIAKIRLRHKLKKELRRLDKAVDTDDDQRRQIDYLRDHIEAIDGAQRNLSDTEVESYTRFGLRYGVPTIGAMTKLSSEVSPDRESGNGGDGIEYWKLFFEPETINAEGWGRGVHLFAIYFGEQDTGMRELSVLTLSQPNESGDMDFSCIQKLFRISDCTIYQDPPELKWHATVEGIPIELNMEKYSIAARGLFHLDGWRKM